jgi:microcystin-dependent protein
MAKPGYVWSGSEWENFSGPSAETLPAGTIAMWVKATPPTGWLLCNGAQYDKTVYAQLFANVGDAYELGTETTGNSRLPNMIDRFVIGSDSRNKVSKQSAYQTNSINAQQHTFVSTIAIGTGNTAHNHNLASFNNDHAHNTNAPTSTGGGDHNHPMNAHNPNAEGGGNVSRTAGGAGSSFSAHSHNANAPSTNGGGAHNHALNGVSTNNANVTSHAHSTNFSSLNTHNHTITNNPVSSAVPTTTVIPAYRAIHYIIKATNG